MSCCSYHKDAPMYVEVSGRLARSRPGSLDLLHFRQFLGWIFLWNLLELNKICMEHNAKTHFIPEKLTIRM